MNREDNTQYYARRARQEREWAERSKNEASRHVHHILAAEYERLVTADRSTA
jgi:hypothetical protein